MPVLPTVAHSVGRLQENFMFRHFWSQIAVVQEVNEPLPCCGLFGINMSEGRIIKNLRTARCDRNTHMRWQISDVEITAKCTGATFSLTGEDGVE